jgi:hypothetical protein
MLRTITDLPDVSESQTNAAHGLLSQYFGSMFLMTNRVLILPPRKRK